MTYSFGPQIYRAGLPTMAAFSPSDVSGLQLWLKADALALNNNDPVASWTDSSVNANHATQSTGSAKPTYKTNTLNGLPVVSFDGGDYLATTNTFALTTISIFIVFRASANGIVYEHGNGNSCYLYTSTGNSIQVTKGATTSGRNRASNWGIGSTWRIVTQTYNGTQATHLLYINGVSQSLTNAIVGDPGTGSNTQTFYVGARGAVPNTFTTGDIAELIVYNALVSSGDQTSIESYLNTKYAVF